MLSMVFSLPSGQLSVRSAPVLSTTTGSPSVTMMMIDFDPGFSVIRVLAYSIAPMRAGRVGVPPPGVVRSSALIRASGLDSAVSWTP